MTEDGYSAAPAEPGGITPIGALTVLYDAGCPLCRAAARWLANRPQLVPLHLVPAGSSDARRRFPAIGPASTTREVTVVADTGAVYQGDSAWLACLWALDSYRDLAYRLATPEMLPLARRVIAAAAAIRERTRSDGYGGDDDRQDCTDGACGYYEG
jgi:predicted DCC family thiol-disulfide oxidoreductase YuxK